MGKYQFDSDIKIGEKFEIETQEFLNRTRPKCNFLKIVGKFDDFDLICEHCYEMIECKHDGKGKYTGNFYFEKKLLENSTCDYLYHKVDYVYVFKFNDLKDILRNFWRDGMRYREGVNADNSEGLVVPIDSLRGIWHIENYEQSGNEHTNTETGGFEPGGIQPADYY